MGEGDRSILACSEHGCSEAVWRRALTCGYVSLTRHRSSNFGLPSQHELRKEPRDLIEFHRRHRLLFPHTGDESRDQSKPMQIVFSDRACHTRPRHTICVSLQSTPWLCGSVVFEAPSGQPKIVSREFRYFVIVNRRLLERCSPKGVLMSNFANRSYVFRITRDLTPLTTPNKMAFGLPTYMTFDGGG